MSKLDDLKKQVEALKGTPAAAEQKPKSGTRKPKSASAPAAPETQVKKRGGHKTTPMPVLPDADMQGLTDKEEIFCQAVVKGKTNSDAYREAYDTSKMKPETVNRKAHELKQYGKITARVAFLRDQAARAAAITESKVLAETGRIAFSDPRLFFDEEGNLIPARQWSDSLAASVKSIKVLSRKTRVDTGENESTVTEETAVVAISLWDKPAALEKLFKHLGMYEKDNRQKADVFSLTFANLPPEAQQLITERLYAIAGNAHRPVIPGSLDAGAGRRAPQ